MPYFYRLLCISLACFFLIHLAGGLLTRILERPLIRKSERLTASSAARLLFGVRLLPSGIAAAIVSLFCIPSYLWLEPRAWPEPVGLCCLIAASLGAITCALSICKAARAIVRSVRYLRRSRPAALELQLPREQGAVWLTEAAFPGLALAGILRPKVLVSRGALSALSNEELQSAIRHERAHQASRDNLKRLLLLLVPDPLPFWSAFKNCDKAWARITEWAADDHVIAAGPGETLSLAAALVRVARLNSAGTPVSLMTSFLSDASGLSARIDRLLESRAPDAQPARRFHLAPAIAATAALFAVFALQSATLRFVHELLERFIR